MHEMPERRRQVMKLIRISTDLKLTVHEFPTGGHAEQNEVLCALIGEDCRIYEHVLPNRLYTELNQKKHPTKIAGQFVSMLIDEEGLLKEHPVPNLIGSYLYETDKHRQPIVGNILFVGEQWCRDGIEFCGIEESVFERLEMQLNNMVLAMKVMKGVMRL